MLHKETVDSSTLELLIQIQQKEYLKGFYLVGGVTLYNDIDLSEWPVIMKTPGLKWETVKHKIKKATQTYLKQL